MDYCRYFSITIFVMLVRICESKIGAPDSLEVDLVAVKGLVDKARCARDMKQRRSNWVAERLASW